MVRQKTVPPATGTAQGSAPVSPWSATPAAQAPEHTRTDLFSYPVFFNPGCGHQHSTETRGRDAAFPAKRLSLLRPDVQALPQHANLEQLEQQRHVLYREQARLTAPRLAGLLLAVIIAALLTLRQNPWLLLIPLGLVCLTWLFTRPAVQAHTRLIRHNRKQWRQQHEILQGLQQQAAALDPALPLSAFQYAYAQRLEERLQHSLREYYPVLDHSALREQLHDGRLEVFLLESRGILQLPRTCTKDQDEDSKLLELSHLLEQSGTSCCALLPYPELQGITRLHYVFALLCSGGRAGVLQPVL
ncbi:MAG: hypothetical protein R3E95_06860 [Thiolinea sp.]